MALGEQRGLVKVLRARFGSVPQSISDEIGAVTTPEDLDVLLDCAAVKPLAEFQAALAEIRQKMK